MCIPVTSDGVVDPRWGRANRVALVDIGTDSINNWEEFDVGWADLHDSGREGEHHARIARFLKDHGVQAVVADHMGPPMAHMLDKMNIQVHLGAAGRARDAVIKALGDSPLR